MGTRIILIFILGITVSSWSHARISTEIEDKPGSIQGQIIDIDLKIPVEYATIALMNYTKTDPLDGTLSGSDGRFLLDNVKPGYYRLEISFIGYEPTSIDSILVQSGQVYDLGEINLMQSVAQLEEVVVSSRRAPIEYKIDRKVIDVSKHYAASSGNAADVLRGVPSVTVDLEGNVSLRGSTGFTVLLDGKPTILEPSEILNQIPASTIQNIEIITNPSAKYDPSGTAGIINIVSKKDRNRGLSGVVNLNGGLNNKYGADFSLNYRTKKINYIFGADYNYRSYPGDEEEVRETYRNDTTSLIRSEGVSERIREFYGIRGGVEVQLSSKDQINLSARYGGRSMEGNDTQNYWQSTLPATNAYQYISDNLWSRSGDYFSANLNYIRQFSGKGHELVFLADFGRRGGDEESSNELKDLDGMVNSGQRSTEIGPGERYTFKLDYTLPLGKDSKFETGIESQFGKSEDDNSVYDYDLFSGDYIYLPEYSYFTTYDQDIHSLYAQFGQELGSFGYQLGLRGEYTYRVLELVGQMQDFTIDDWDIYPTVHLSYKARGDQQFMASYTRRIERPRGWYLEPFVTWTDAYNVRQGNPSLLPEYIDSYEAGYKKTLGEGFISAEMYYRVTHNKVERVRESYEEKENVLLSTFANVGQDYSLGVELMYSKPVVKWWNADLLANLYNYKVKGILYEAPYEESSFNWNARFNNSFFFSKKFEAQLNGNYNSKTVTAQGTRSARYSVDAALKANLLNRKMSFIIQVHDVFQTGKHEYESSGPDFYLYSSHVHEAPIVTATITYRINNNRPDRRGRNGGSGGRDMDDNMGGGDDDF